MLLFDAETRARASELLLSLARDALSLETLADFIALRDRLSEIIGAEQSTP